MDMGMVDMDILPKEQLVLLKDLIATATIVNVKKDMYIVVDMAKEDTVRFDPFFLLLIVFYWLWFESDSIIPAFFIGKMELKQS